MLKKIRKTLSLGLTGMLALTIGVANADTTARRAPNLLHEMVPHVVLPETIQYNKTAKNMPGYGYFGATSPYVATYVAYPSYQVHYTAVFRPIGQSVYPVSPQVPPPLPKPQREIEPAIEENFVWQEIEGKDVQLSPNIAEPIRLASGAEAVIPVLPMPDSVVVQTGIFCQHPAKPPSAWAFSSPLFKIASVPGGWGGGQTGSITHNSPRGSGQHLGFMPIGGDSAMAGAAPQGVPYSTFQMGRGTEQDLGTQVHMLPNGMVLLTMPPNHHNCGLLRCRTGHVPRTILLPPAGHFQQPPPPAMMPQGMMAPAPMMHNAMMPSGMMQGGMHFMPVAQQQPMMQPMMPQMQMVPVTAMTPMGPAIVGYQQVPMMNPMVNPMMNQMTLQQVQATSAVPNPMTASQVSAIETSDGSLQPPSLIGGVAGENPMALVATPFGYAIQIPSDALQTDAAAQLAQMQQALLQSQIQQMQMQMQMPMNLYAGMQAAPFGYPAMMPQQGGMTVSDMLQIMAFLNSNKPQRRARLFERIAERREARRVACDDLFTQLMQAWTTPYAAPDTTLRMPSRNAYPYGYFGVQASPISTANYGGYHNLYFGNTTYPGLY